MQEEGKLITDISERILKLIDLVESNPNDFAKRLGYGRSQAIYDIINGKAKPSFDFFQKLLSSEYSDTVNVNWLITGKGDMAISTIPDQLSKDVDLKSRPIGRPISKSEDLGLQKYTEPISVYNKNTIAVPVLDMKAAAAWFGGGFHPGDHIEHLSHITLPTSLVKRGRKYFFIPVEGESMQPTLLKGDLLLASLLDKSEYQDITTGRVYVIATGDDGVVVKRVKNRLKEFGFIRALSDNNQHVGYNIQEDQITSILEIAFKISFDLSNVATSLQGQIDDLTDRMEEIELLLKKPR